MYKDDKEDWRWSNSADQKILVGCGKNHFMFDFEILSGTRTKKRMMQKIRQTVRENCKNKNFKRYKKADLDFAIYLEIGKDYSRQDLDNVQKIVLDAFKNYPQRDEDPSWDYLYEDDAQIRRILVWKSKKIIYYDKLFNWNDIINNDDEKQKVRNFLVTKLGYDYFQAAEFEKTNDLTIRVFAKRLYSFFRLDNETKMVTLERNGKIYKFVTEIEGDRLDVFYDSGIDTISTTISFRIHDPKKQMNMRPLYKLSKYGMIG